MHFLTQSSSHQCLPPPTPSAQLPCLAPETGRAQLTSLVHIHPSHLSHLPTQHLLPATPFTAPPWCHGLGYSLTFPGSECHAMGTLKPWARYLLLVMAHLLAMGLGAVVLQALEGPPALHLQAQLQAELAAFQADHRACLPPEALEELLGAILTAQAHGVSSLGNGSETSNWDLPSALLFTASILTTTGRPPPPPGKSGGGSKNYRVQALPPPQSSRQSHGSIRPDITTRAPHTTHPNWCLHLSCQERSGLPSPTPQYSESSKSPGHIGLKPGRE